MSKTANKTPTSGAAAGAATADKSATTSAAQGGGEPLANNTPDSTIPDTASRADPMQGPGGEGNAALHHDETGDGDNTAGDAATRLKAEIGGDAAADAARITAQANAGLPVADPAREPIKVGAQGGAGGAAHAATLTEQPAQAAPLSLSGASGAAFSVLGFSLPQVVTMVGMVAEAATAVMAPGATVVGMSVAQLAKLGVGVAEAIPSAVEAFNEIKNAMTRGDVPTQADWDRWDAAAEAAHADLQAAAKRVTG